MKVRLNAIVVALLLVCGLLIETSSLANQQPQQAKQKLIITSQGTLLEYDAYGTSPMKKITRDGFELNYKTRGKMKSAYAIGKTRKGLRTSSEPSKVEGDTAAAVVQTADKSLEITSNFIYNTDTGELFIKRKFRNISKYSVTLQSIRDYVDPGVMVRSGAIKPADLTSTSINQITAGLEYPNDCNMLHECSPPPVCIYPPGCPRPDSKYPGYKSQRAHLYRSKKRVVLGWSKPITLQPKQKQQSGGEVDIVIRLKIK